MLFSSIAPYHPILWRKLLSLIFFLHLRIAWMNGDTVCLMGLHSSWKSSFTVWECSLIHRCYWSIDSRWHREHLCSITYNKATASLAELPGFSYVSCSWDALFTFLIWPLDCPGAHPEKCLEVVVIGINGAAAHLLNSTK